METIEEIRERKIDAVEKIIKILSKQLKDNEKYLEKLKGNKWKVFIKQLQLV